jgi:hypothetical protein
MNQALAKISNTQLETLDDVMKLGDVFFRSGLFSDTKQAAQCVVKILAGQELGFSPIASMMGINIIQGKVSLGANLIAAKIQSSGKYDFKFREHTEKKCTLEFFKGNESVGFSEFTIQEATNAGLSQKDNWKKHPKNMLFARAVSNGARWFTAELFNGAIYTPEEMGADVDGETGEVIGEPQPQQRATIHALPPPESQPTTETATPEQTTEQKQIQQAGWDLFQANAIQRVANSYNVTFLGGMSEVFKNSEGKIECTCESFVDSTDDQFVCEHIVAVYHFRKQQAELDAKAAAESAR